MKFEEALVELKSGKKLRRKYWPDGVWLWLINSEFFKRCYDYDWKPCIRSVCLNDEELKAQDWEVLE
jgi:hypothetical protein